MFAKFVLDGAGQMDVHATKTSLSKAAGIIVLIGACSSSVVGQTAKDAPKSTDPGGEIISAIDLEGFQRILQGMGFEVTRDKDANGKLVDYLYFQTEGYRSLATMNDGEVALLNVTTGKFIPTTFNDWNSKNASCCFAFLSEDNLAYLATQLGVEGGTTRASVESRVKKFRDSVALWKRFLAEHQVKETPPVKPPGQ
jgi:hypothetical protein